MVVVACGPIAASRDRVVVQPLMTIGPSVTSTSTIKTETVLPTSLMFGIGDLAFIGELIHVGGMRSRTGRGRLSAGTLCRGLLPLPLVLRARLLISSNHQACLTL